MIGTLRYMELWQSNLHVVSKVFFGLFLFQCAVKYDS